MGYQGRVVFSSGKYRDYDIFSIDLETMKVSQLTDGDCLNDAPKWSPDGKKIVYLSNQSGSPEIWMMDANGYNQTRITTHNSWHNAPSWSPDGKRLVFTANYGKNIDVYTMNIDGSDVQQITDYPEMDSLPQFSPDGETIVYSSKKSGNSDIWVYRYKNDSYTKLTEFAGRDCAATYSPDGKKIAFITGIINKEDNSENLELCLMDADGKNQKVVIYNPGEDRHVTWSPDGKYLMYTSSKQHSTEERIMIADIAKMKSKELKFDRAALENELEVKPKAHVTLFKWLPESLVRMTYPDAYFGTERYPDWTE